MMVPLRCDPTVTSFGHFLISIRQPWSSVRCQWKTFMLCMAKRSRNFLINAMEKKCREQSRCMPRQLNRGASVTVADVRVRVSGDRLLRNVWIP